MRTSCSQTCLIRQMQFEASLISQTCLIRPLGCDANLIQSNPSYQTTGMWYQPHIVKPVWSDHWNVMSTSDRQTFLIRPLECEVNTTVNLTTSTMTRFLCIWVQYSRHCCNVSITLNMLALTIDLLMWASRWMQWLWFIYRCHNHMISQAMEWYHKDGKYEYCNTLWLSGYIVFRQSHCRR